MYTHISVCIWLCKLFFCIFSHAFASPITHSYIHIFIPQPFFSCPWWPCPFELFQIWWLIKATRGVYLLFFHIYALQRALTQLKGTERQPGMIFGRCLIFLDSGAQKQHERSFTKYIHINNRMLCFDVVT